MTDRDTFAAAALTGLLTRREYDACEFATVCEYAYRYADAMLRERSRAGQKMAESAIPRAVCPERDNHTASVDEGATASAASMGCDVLVHTNHDAAPAAKARTDADRNRTDKAAPRPSEGTGDTPAVTEPMPKAPSGSGSVTPDPYSRTDENRVDSLTKRDTTQPRNGALDEPVAWAVACGDCVDSLFTDRDEAVEWACGIIPPPHIVPLYRSPTLTDAEREAIQEVIDYLQPAGQRHPNHVATTLRGLLERLGNDATSTREGSS